LDAAAILRALAQHQVDYVVIGGLAVQAYGHTRTTQDVDIVPAPDPANLARLEAALAEIGARAVGAGVSASVRVPDSGVLELDTDVGGVDIHRDPPGAPPYPELKAHALLLELEVSVAVAGRDDLIAMKYASGRPIDRGDILALTEPGPDRS
jgi:hypothetical protein